MEWHRLLEGLPPKNETVLLYSDEIGIATGYWDGRWLFCETVPYEGTRQYWKACKEFSHWARIELPRRTSDAATMEQD